MKRYRKSINIEYSNYVINELDKFKYSKIDANRYHYIINLHGKVKEGGNKDFSDGIYICLHGGKDLANYTKDTRTPEQTEALFTLICQLMLIHDIEPNSIYMWGYVDNQIKNKVFLEYAMEDLMREMEKWLYDEMLGSDDN